MFVDVTPQPGTQKNPQQTGISQPCFTDTDHVHFPDGRLTTLPPYAEASISNPTLELLGGARFIHGQKYTGTYEGSCWLIGTNTRLYALKNGFLYNITPLAGQKSELLGTDPFSINSGDATLVVTWVNHGLSVGDDVTFYYSDDFAGIDAATYVNIEHSVTVVTDADTFEVELGTTASSTDTTAGGSLVVARSLDASTTLGTNPIRSLYDNQATISANAFTFTSGSTTVSVRTTILDSNLAVNETFTIAGATGTYNGVPASELNGTHRVRSFDGNGYPQIYVSTAATSSGTPATSGVTATSAKIRVAHTAHGHIVGDRIRLHDATGPVGGIPASEINAEHIIVALDGANAYVVNVTTEATSYTDGGGTAVHEHSQIAAGNLGQDIAYGWGSGVYGSEIVGSGEASSSAQTFPRIWSGAQFGNETVLCPGDYAAGDGQKIYIWDGNLNIAPTIAINAPTNCNYVTVVNNAVVALCGRQIQISQLGDATVWSGITTFASREQEVWKLISAKPYTEKECVIFAPNKAFLLNYTGDADLWDLREIFNEDGIIGPNACTVLNAAMIWRGYRGSYVFDGAPPRLIDNSQNDDWINQNTNYAQSWKGFCYADQQSGEWYYHFATGSSSEPSDYVIYNQRNGSHTLGMMDRTAAQQVPMLDNTFYMANSTSTSTAGTLYRHFTNGAVAFDWYAITSYSYVAKGELRGFIRKFLPDSTQSGSCSLNILTKEYPQGTVTTSGTYTFTGTQKYITVKAAGKLVATKFSGSVAFTIGSWLMDVITRGRR